MTLALAEKKPDYLVTESFSGRQWRLRDADERHCLALAQRLGVPDVLARLLCHRGIGVEEAALYLAPTLRELLPDPFHLKDMKKAATRIAESVRIGETIGIFGDYDVDGATSSACLIRYFSQLGIPTAVHIPDRQKEGYGPNITGMRRLKSLGAKLIICVDTGTLAFTPLAEAAGEGLDVIVVDHHQGEATLPKAVAVVNPNRFDETSAQGHLAAVGVVFLLLVAINKTLREAGYFNARPEPDLRQLLDIVALGTVCDVVPLLGVNRAFVLQGLKILRQRNNIGLAALMDVSGLTEPASTYHLGYILGPRINAGGRVGEADLGTRLLTTDSPEEARQIALQLDHYNKERKALEAQVLEQAMAQAQMQANRAFILAQGDHWHEGVIGIVAGRLKESFNRPAAVVAWNEAGEGKASARSIKGVDIGQAIIAARQEGLLLKGGGHAMAAGFTLAREKCDAFLEFMESRLASDVAENEAGFALSIDGAVPISAATPVFASLIEQVGPFGAGNNAPRLLVSDVTVVSADVVGENHLRCMVADAAIGGRASSSRLKVMAFREAESPLGQQILNARGRRLQLAGKLKLESWQGRESVTLMLDDAAWAA